MKHSNKPRDIKLGMFKIWMRLYTDEIEDFVKKYYKSYNRRGMECFKHRYLLLEDTYTAGAALDMNSDVFNAFLRKFRKSMLIALENAYRSGDYRKITHRDED